MTRSTTPLHPTSSQSLPPCAPPLPTAYRDGAGGRARPGDRGLHRLRQERGNGGLSPLRQCIVNAVGVGYICRLRPPGKFRGTECPNWISENVFISSRSPFAQVQIVLGRQIALDISSQTGPPNSFFSVRSSSCLRSRRPLRHTVEDTAVARLCVSLSTCTCTPALGCLGLSCVHSALFFFGNSAVCADAHVEKCQEEQRAGAVGPFEGKKGHSGL